MAASYWLLVSDELMAADPDWAAAGLSEVEEGGYERPGMRWRKFRDENADAALEGCEVELSMARVDGRPVITSRQVIRP